jgi:hypothetical protein
MPSFTSQLATLRYSAVYIYTLYVTKLSIYKLVQLTKSLSMISKTYLSKALANPKKNCLVTPDKPIINDPSTMICKWLDK